MPTKKPASKKSTKPVTPKAIKKPLKVVADIGSYGAKVQADQDALQFKHPNVFAYRSAIFPNPADYKVEVKVTKADVVAVKGNPMYPWGLNITLEVSGDLDKADGWVLAFKNRSRRPVYSGEKSK